MSNQKSFQYKSWRCVKRLGMILFMVLMLHMLTEVSSNNPSHETLAETSKEMDVVYIQNVANDNNTLTTKYTANIGMALENINNTLLLNEIIKPKGDDEENKNENILESSTYEEDEPKPIILNYKLEKVGYTKDRLNVRTRPNTDSEVLTIYPINKKVKYSSYNDEWVVTKYKGEYVYLSKKYISKKRVKISKKTNTIDSKYTVKSVSNDKRKSYMDYRCITSTGSLQYKLQSKYAYTASNGVRAVDGRYCIALGSYYTHKVGQYVDLILANGTVIPCIIGDAKANQHTTSNNSLGIDGGVAEFIVDTRSLSRNVTRMGDVSYSSDKWKSNVVKIKIYDKSLF